ncbi:hypothetical protein E2C01_075725 [Portunus trituberculatus]|uniref:Uncharacterized protein n=1 Tax=Portunus trituberculatus TaxID=210409 RepID=A0A5B7IL26_PORTR|nr:hypothetical protein [Portunus trituberculatus]
MSFSRDPLTPPPISMAGLGRQESREVSDSRWQCGETVSVAPAQQARPRRGLTVQTCTASKMCLTLTKPPVPHISAGYRQPTSQCLDKNTTYIWLYQTPTVNVSNTQHLWRKCLSHKEPL